jgi:hypothetical protein
MRIAVSSGFQVKYLRALALPHRAMIMKTLSGSFWLQIDAQKAQTTLSNVDLLHAFVSLANE